MQSLIELVGSGEIGMPLMAFSFGQIPGFFSTDRFFIIVSQIITQVLEGFSTGFITLFTDALFGIPV